MKRVAPYSLTRDAEHPYSLWGTWSRGGYATAQFFGLVHAEWCRPDDLADAMAHAQNLPEDVDAPVPTPAPAADVELARAGERVRSDRRLGRIFAATEAVRLAARAA